MKSGIFVDENSEVSIDAIIEPGCFITNSRIDAGAKVLAYSVVKESIIEAGATVGPFTYLRPGSLVSEGAKVGAFVEVKNSKIGKKSKVPHLSYVGDATVGSGTNIGCGVVFCNYDGKNKFKTTIGDNCFIGANTNLIAPVEVGQGAFIAAGSTVTKEVAAGEFAIARARQENKEMPEKLKH